MRGTTNSSQFSGVKVQKKKKNKAIPFVNHTPVKIRPHSSSFKGNSGSKTLSKYKPEKHAFSHVPKPKKGRESIKDK